MLMRSLLLIAILSLTTLSSWAQFTYKIKADSVLITNDSCTAELNLENSTKNITGGFLYNRWKGRTEFRKILLKVDDSTYTLNGDTVTINSGSLSSLPISSLTAATQTNTIDNLGYKQEWRWNSLGATSGLKLSSNSTTANANVQTVLEVDSRGTNSNANQQTYGSRITNEHTGTNSQNVGLYVKAMNGSINHALVAEVGSGSSNNAAYLVGNGGSPLLHLHQLDNTSHSSMLFHNAGAAVWAVGAKGNTGAFAINASQFFSGVEPLNITYPTGQVGIHMSGATAKIQIGAGQIAAGTAPLKFTAGNNMTTPENGAVEYNGTNYFVTSNSTRYTLAKTLTTTAALNFGSTSAGNSADLTITVTGAADGDAVSLGVPNAAVNANSNFTAWVSAADTVTVRFNNYSSGAIDPASATFRISVLKY